MPYAPPPESTNAPLDPARLADSTRTLVESIHADRRTRHLGSALLPDRDQVIETLDKLQTLLFPGFFGRRGLTEDELKSHVTATLEKVGRMLFAQITAALRYAHDLDVHSGDEAEADVTAECETRARGILSTFITRLANVRRMLSLDVQAAYDGDPAAQHTDEIIFSYPGLRALAIHRLAHELYRQSVPLIPRMMAEHAHATTGIDIHPGARIGRSFFIDHGTGVVIGETTVIGDHCKIYQGVTLGAKSFPKDEKGQFIRDAKRHPTLEDHVTVYAGATILGGDTTIGAGSVINGGVFLTNSVPTGHIVRAPKAELTLRDNPDLPPGSWMI